MPAKPQQAPKTDTKNDVAKKPVRANAWNKPLQSSKIGTPSPPPGILSASAQPKREGVVAATTTTTATAPISTLPGGASSHLPRHRVVHLALSLVGSHASVTLLDGAVVEGIFHTYTPFGDLAPTHRNKVVLKSAKIAKDGDGKQFADFQSGGTIVISTTDVAMLHAKRVEWDPINRATASSSSETNGRGKTDEFITDAEISGRQGGRNKNLVAAGSAWVAGPGGPSKGQPLDDGKGKVAGTAGLRGNIGSWDQFKANQQLFNVSATFDENLYTTQLDKSSIGLAKKTEAERIAREIEGSTSTNIHIAEERGQKMETDFDEEDRYSGVLTMSGKNRHEAKTSSVQGSTPGRDLSRTSTTKGKAGHVMNYAAAAAKPNARNDKPATSKVAPPGFVSKSGTTATAATDRKAAPPTPEKSKGKDAKSKGAVDAKAGAPATAPRKSDTTAAKQGAAPLASSKTSEKKDAGRSSNPEASAETAKKDTAGGGGGGGPAKDTVSGGAAAKKDSASEAASSSKPSKLSATAKTFIFNPSAKSFTPSSVSPAPAPQSAAPGGQQSQAENPVHVMPPNAMHGGHYMQPPAMNQPAGMINVMNMPYGGMGYQAPYGNMEQHPHPMQPVVPNQPQFAPSGPDAAKDGEAKVDGDADTNTPQQGIANPAPHAQQTRGAPMTHYGIPPHVPFYGNGMPVPGHNPTYGGHFVTAAQPIPVGPNGAPYRHMFPVPNGVAPPMHVGGNAAPPYNGGPMAYAGGGYMPHGGMDDSDVGGRGRGGRGHGGRGRRSGRGRGRGGGRGGGGSGGGYQNYGSHSGRQGATDGPDRDSAQGHNQSSSADNHGGTGNEQSS